VNKGDPTLKLAQGALASTGVESDALDKAFEARNFRYASPRRHHRCLTKALSGDVLIDVLALALAMGERISNQNCGLSVDLRTVW
jgi:hypothetical protein